jgi:hypothetical protein
VKPRRTTNPVFQVVLLPNNCVTPFEGSSACGSSLAGRVAAVQMFGGFGRSRAGAGNQTVQRLREEAGKVECVGAYATA